MGFLTDFAINAVCEAMVNNETEQDNQQRCEDIIQYAHRRNGEPTPLSLMPPPSPLRSPPFPSSSLLAAWWWDLI